MSPLHTLASALAVAAAVGATPSAQSIAECPTSPCELTAPAAVGGPSELWRDAAAIHAIKLRFVDAFQRFLRAEAGTFGDEGGALIEAVEAMAAAVAEWDRAIAQLEMRARRVASRQDAHLVAATVWLDRQRPDRALRELDDAERIGDRADVHAVRALALAALKRTADAAQSWRRVVAVNPDNVAAYYMVATSQAELGRVREAAEARRGFERALLRQRPSASGATPAPFERIDLLRQASGVAPIFTHARYASGVGALQAGDYGAAVARLRNAMAGDPINTAADAVRNAIKHAARALRDGQVEPAIAELRAFTDAAPDHAEVHRLLGLAYWLGDEQGRSIDHLRRAMTLAPNDERAVARLADVLVSERRFAEAERELLAWPQRSAAIVYRLAQIYQRQSLLEQAASAMRESDTFSAVVGRDYFYQSWGNLLVNQADFDGAVSVYRRRIEVNPNSADGHRQLGEIHVLQGQHDEALTEFAVATWLDPTDAKAHAAAGQVYARIGRNADAIAALTRALTLDDTLREARYTLGTVLLRTGRAEEGRAALELFGRQQAEAQALGQREFELDALRRRASTHALAGEHSQAVAVLEQIATVDPQHSRSHRDLGVALLRAKRPAEAIEPLRRAQQLEETADGYAHLADAYAAAGNSEESSRMRAAYSNAVRRARLERLKGLTR